MIDFARLENAAPVFVDVNETLPARTRAALRRIFDDEVEIVVEPALLTAALHDGQHDLPGDDRVEYQFGDIATVRLTPQSDAVVARDDADGADMRSAIDRPLRHIGWPFFCCLSPTADAGCVETDHHSSSVGGVATSTVAEGEGPDNV